MKDVILSICLSVHLYISITIDIGPHNTTPPYPTNNTPPLSLPYTAPIYPYWNWSETTQGRND